MLIAAVMLHFNSTIIHLCHQHQHL